MGRTDFPLFYCAPYSPGRVLGDSLPGPPLGYGRKASKPIALHRSNVTAPCFLGCARAREVPGGSRH